MANPSPAEVYARLREHQAQKSSIAEQEDRRRIKRWMLDIQMEEKSRAQHDAERKALEDNLQAREDEYNEMLKAQEIWKDLEG